MHGEPKDFETREQERAARKVLDARLENAEGEMMKPIEHTLHDLLDPSCKPNDTTLSATERLTKAAAQAEDIRQKLCRVGDLVGASFGVCEEVSMPKPSGRGGLHGKIDDLQETLFFLNNIADSLLEAI